MSFKKIKLSIVNRQSTIGVIGLGYVGLPLAIRFSEVGFSTIGFDIDQEKIDVNEYSLCLCAF